MWSMYIHALGDGAGSRSEKRNKTPQKSTNVGIWDMMRWDGTGWDGMDNVPPGSEIS